MLSYDVDFTFGAAVVSFPNKVTPRFNLFAHTIAGYYYGVLHDGSGTGGGNPFISPGFGLTFDISDRHSLGVEAAYNGFLDFYNNWSISLGTAVHFSRGPQDVLTQETTDNAITSVALKAAPKVEIPAALR